MTNNEAPAPTVKQERDPRCVPASEAQLDNIRAGIKDVQESNDIKTGWAVRSKDYERVWMVAAKIYGPNMENGTGPGVWAMNGELDSPGITMSVDGFAKEFSVWPDASKTDAAITFSSDGVEIAKSCAKSD